MTESRGAYSVWVGNLNRRYNFEHPGVDGRIILKCIFKK
jgi:hypothetical protein